MADDRVERHLSRQRGAGLTTSFGFSFGILAAPATPALPTLDEPPTKRRKTEKRELSDVARDRENTTPREDLVTDNQEREQQPKAEPGRQFGARIEKEAVAGEGSLEGEDVRLRIKPSGKKPTRRKKGDAVQHPEAEIGGGNVDLASSRPRRRAAESAILKVAEVYIEEAAPIDKKRRAVEPEKPRPRGRKKAAVVEDLAAPEVERVAINIDEDVGATESKGAPARGKRTTTKIRKPDLGPAGSARPARRKRQIKTLDTTAMPDMDAPAKGACAIERPPLAEAHPKSRAPSMSPEKPSKAKKQPTARAKAKPVKPVAPRPSHEVSDDHVTIEAPEKRAKRGKVLIDRDEPSLETKAGAGSGTVVDDVVPLAGDEVAAMQTEPSALERGSKAKKTTCEKPGLSKARPVNSQKSVEGPDRANLENLKCGPSATKVVSAGQAQVTESNTAGTGGDVAREDDLGETRLGRIGRSDITTATDDQIDAPSRDVVPSAQSSEPRHTRVPAPKTRKAAGKVKQTKAGLPVVPITSLNAEERLKTSTESDDRDGTTQRAAEQDIDWLFEAETSTRLWPKREVARVVKRREMQGTAKAQEMDLDDLLVNIKSFARADPPAGARAGSKSAMRKDSVARSTAAKRKR